MGNNDTQEGASARKWPSLKQALILVLSGVVLAAGSCFGFIRILNKDYPGSILTVPGFFLGCFLVLVGLGLLIVHAVRAIRNR